MHATAACDWCCCDNKCGSDNAPFWVDASWHRQGPRIRHSTVARCFVSTCEKIAIGRVVISRNNTSRNCSGNTSIPLLVLSRVVAAQSPPNVFVQRYYYLLKGLGVFSRRATTGTNSEAIFRSIEEQATQDVWWECETFVCLSIEAPLARLLLALLSLFIECFICGTA